MARRLRPAGGRVAALGALALRRAGDVVVRADAYDLELDPAVAVDVTAALALARRVEGSAASISATEAGELCRTDDLLPGWYDEPWLDIERDASASGASTRSSAWPSA